MNKPKHIKEKIALLQAAKSWITDGNCKGLCYAVNHCDPVGNLNSDSVMSARIELVRYFNKAIKDNVFLEGWQSDNGFKHRSAIQTIQDRLDWIDWMIADYKKWGKP